MKYILHIDECFRTRKVLLEALTDIHCTIEAADDGAHALKILHTLQKPYDLIIMDYPLDPQLNTHNLLIEVRKLAIHQDSPCVVLAANHHEHDRILHLENGFIDCFEKTPEDLNRLKRFILEEIEAKHKNKTG